VDIKEFVNNMFKKKKNKDNFKEALEEIEKEQAVNKELKTFKKIIEEK